LLIFGASGLLTLEFEKFDHKFCLEVGPGDFGLSLRGIRVASVSYLAFWVLYAAYMLVKVLTKNYTVMVPVIFYYCKDMFLCLIFLAFFCCGNVFWMMVKFSKLYHELPFAYIETTIYLQNILFIGFLCMRKCCRQSPNKPIAIDLPYQRTIKKATNSKPKITVSDGVLQIPQEKFMQKKPTDNGKANPLSPQL
jgi:hypothetical protein